MFYYLYKITNLKNKKVYVGVHKTNDLADGYMGSGKLIIAAIKKYGLDFFKKEIIEFFNSEHEMFNREREVVTEEFVTSGNTYNLTSGGNGGFSYINRNGLQRVARINANNTMLTKYGEDFLRIIGKKGSEVLRSNGQLEIAANRIRQYPGNKTEQQKANSIKAMNSPEAKAKKKLTWEKTGKGKGQKNSQFGSMWITDGISNQKIKKTDTIPDGWQRGRTLPGPV